MPEATCPVAQHDRQYSDAGLLQRYAGYKVGYFKTRMLFASGWCVFLVSQASLEIALLCFALVVLGDLIETTYMKRLRQISVEKIDIARAKRTALITGLADAIGVATAAGIATYFCALETFDHHVHWEPIFAVYLLMGMGVSYVMFLPLNPIPVVSRVMMNFVVAMLILVAGVPEPDVTPDAHVLDIGGLVAFCLITIWLAHLVKSRHERHRKTELKLVKQQQELQGAYAKMYAQQIEARRLALVAETANDSVMIIDQEFKITWVNHSFTRITGYSADEANGHRPGDLLSCEETNTALVHDLNAQLCRGDAVRAVLLNKRKDGQHIWLEISQVPMMNAKGELESVIAVERDITEAKEHENELERARQAAEEGARSKADFLATMSHEIRTPLNGVIGMTQLLEHTALDADQRTYAETIHSSARSLLALINDILELSKMDARDVTLVSEDFAVRSCFASAEALLKPLAQEKNIDLGLSIDEGVPTQLNGDDRRITQILMNIVGNAIKFTNEGSVQIAVTCEEQDGKPLLCFSVTDTGIGMSPDVQQRVFESFSQADAAISRQFGGTGLGLTISQRLANAMGGEITVSSSFGLGTVFTTRLLLQHSQGDAVGAKSETTIAATLENVRILVADDNRVNRVLVQKFLKDSGAQFGFAVDGEQAIEMAIAFEPTIILMDLSMPNVDGLCATRAIRDLDIPQPYIVALTANAFADDRDACLDAGMDDFLSKPVGRQQLLDNLTSAMAQRAKGQPTVSLCTESNAGLRNEQKGK